MPWAVWKNVERCAATYCGECEKIDLGGGALYPGFILIRIAICPCMRIRSAKSIAAPDWALFRAFSTGCAKPPGIRLKIAGLYAGYAHDDTGIDEKRHLTREDLDGRYPRNARSWSNIFPSIFAT